MNTISETNTVVESPRKKMTMPRGRRPRAASSKPTSQTTAPSPRVTKVKLIRVPLSEIVVGDRHRKDVGNLASLARAIEESGIIEPIIVDSEMRLVDGYRRLLVAKGMKLGRIDALVMNIEDPLLAYVAVSGQRKRLTCSERFAIVEELLQRAKDPEWRTSALGGRLQGADQKGRLDEFVASHVGLSRETLRKIRLIHACAREDSSLFGDLARELDMDGKVDRHFRELQRRLLRGGAATVRAIVVEPNWATRFGSVDIGDTVREANLAAWSSEDCILLVPAPVASLSQASQIIALAGYRWVRTFAGPDGIAWLIAVFGKRADIDLAVEQALMEACVRGIEEVKACLDSLSKTPHVIELGAG